MWSLWQILWTLFLQDFLYLKYTELTDEYSLKTLFATWFNSQVYNLHSCSNETIMIPGYYTWYKYILLHEISCINFLIKQLDCTLHVDLIDNNYLTQNNYILPWQTNMSSFQLPKGKRREYRMSTFFFMMSNYHSDI